MEWDDLLFGPPGFDVDGHPHFERGPGGELVKAEGGEEADAAARDAKRRLDYRMVLADVGVGGRIETATDPFQLLLPVEGQR
jgi:hypothetical protein